ncbi:monooxygenase-like protein [Thermochaetoides thermophila DSM 1495]|uniref:Monooxygenase-like protein n=1 Tax=Chaetomium thermophilum (strain DSM 1495 / CBS 144.50 / IMI 039719) TaxID=759272 RepID=G0S2P7_CHATD|nr:monooxygenase-like protein [Thermochaetoides thermophila DSM 1495]EGS22280.1 monooxygenase-like protein [Thermochaetoides thermophila DSM 1495]
MEEYRDRTADLSIRVAKQFRQPICSCKTSGKRAPKKKPGRKTTSSGVSKKKPDRTRASRKAQQPNNPNSADNHPPFNTKLRPPWLWPIPDTRSPSDQLCEVCAALDLFEYLAGYRTIEEDPPKLKLGNVSDLVQKPWCPLCRLILTGLRLHRGDAMLEDPNASVEYVRERSLLVSVEGEEYPHKVYFGIKPLVTDILDKPLAKITPDCIQPLRPEGIDFGLVRLWLEYCEKHHGPECQTSELLKALKLSHPTQVLGNNFRCIDVEIGCVVSPPPNARYVALSYVWGPYKVLKAEKSNIYVLKMPGAFFNKPEIRDHLPKTIRDAMVVTKEIGLRYLWVDSFCILQGDEEETPMQLRSMNLIYAGAYLVIIAAGGDNANAGIAGVQPGSRGISCQQLIEQIRPGFRIGIDYNWEMELKESKYRTRGWTFQEERLANRMLVFIGGTVAFQCRIESESRSEYLAWSPTREFVRREESIPPDWLDIAPRADEDIELYMERELSLVHDIYNAFAGVAQLMKHYLCSDFCHGLPTIFFTYFLCWTVLDGEHFGPGPAGSGAASLIPAGSARTQMII